ncbi:MAG: GNAT family N-acetyltransferase [Ruminococcus sp.]|nr:GNAT family N-acetyltransferase [Ruminococcus sp.]
MNKADTSSYRRFLAYIENTPCGEVYPRSIAEMKQYGDIFTVDDALLFWHYSGFAFIYGKCSDVFFEDLYRDFLSPGINLSRRFVLFTADSRIEKYFRTKSRLVFNKRFNFDFQREFNVTSTTLPSEFSIRRFDDELFDSVTGRITPRFSWRSYDEFMKNGFGFCVLHNGIPASWAFSAAVSDDEVDIGVETAPDYRHMGLASIAANQMIRCCFEEHKRPVWSCDEGNSASRKLAEKLGFVLVSEFTTIKKQTV